MTETLLVDELANELRHYRHSKMASCALAEHILAIPRIHDLARENIALREAMGRIAAQGCGCSPPCQCLSEGSLRIWREEVLDIAKAALKPSEEM
jgi:hypothetical protein